MTDDVIDDGNRASQEFSIQGDTVPERAASPSGHLIPYTDPGKRKSMSGSENRCPSNQIAPRELLKQKRFALAWSSPLRHIDTLFSLVDPSQAQIPSFWRADPSSSRSWKRLLWGHWGRRRRMRKCHWVIMLFTHLVDLSEKQELVFTCLHGCRRTAKHFNFPSDPATLLFVEPLRHIRKPKEGDDENHFP